jgi:hypothetical protein
VLLSEADAVLAPVTAIDGFLLSCVIEPSTGMIIGSASSHEKLSAPAAAAGAADLSCALALLAAKLAAGDEFEELIITYSNHLYLMRPIQTEPGQRALLLLILDRHRANLAIARHKMRVFCDSIS